MAQKDFIRRCRIIGNAIVPEQLRFAIFVITNMILRRSDPFLKKQTGDSMGSYHPRFGYVNPTDQRVNACPTPVWQKPNLSLMLIDDNMKKKLGLWPTPRASSNGHCLRLTERCALDLPSALRYEAGTNYKCKERMNLNWVEWLMGLPCDWTRSL